MSKKSQHRYRFNLLFWMIFPLIAVISIQAIIINFTDKTNNNKQVAETYSSVQTLESFESIERNGSGYLTLWFDDAWSSQYSAGFNMVKQFGMTGTLAVSTELIGLDAYASWEQIREMSLAGWEVTSHSQNHLCEIESLSFEQLNNEQEQSRNKLNYYGIETKIYVPPCGALNPITESLTLYHYDYQRLVERGFNSLPIEDNYALKLQQVDRETTLDNIHEWLNEAQNEDLWLILMFHQIGDGNEEYSTSPDILRKILNKVQESDIQVVTPSQLLD